MRTLDEKLAEIERRSEKIRSQRRKRKKAILSVCVPALLCAGLCAVFYETDVGQENLPEIEIATAPVVFTENIQQENAVAEIKKIAVSGSGFSKTYTEQAQVLPIWECLQDVSGMMEISSSETDVLSESVTIRGETFDTNAEDDASEYAQGYTITVTLTDGETIQYVLLENVLESGSEKLLITSAQKQELYDLLGIDKD